MKLLLGTTNPAKIKDYKKYLLHSNLELLTLQDARIFEEPLEIGKTFEENAMQKAKFYADYTEYPTVADDGGFEVDALDGQPGVDSRRWVGLNGTDEDRIQKVFKLLEGTPQDKRTARLKAVMAVYLPGEREYLDVKFSIGGIIPEKPSRVLIPGYPYRSVLFLPELNKFYSELTDEEYEEVNHRKTACKELLLKLEPWLNN